MCTCRHTACQYVHGVARQCRNLSGQKTGPRSRTPIHRGSTYQRCLQTYEKLTLMPSLDIQATGGPGLGFAGIAKSHVYNMLHMGSTWCLHGFEVSFRRGTSCNLWAAKDARALLVTMLFSVQSIPKRGLRTAAQGSAELESLHPRQQIHERLRRSPSYDRQARNVHEGLSAWEAGLGVQEPRIPTSQPYSSKPPISQSLLKSWQEPRCHWCPGSVGLQDASTKPATYSPAFGFGWNCEVYQLRGLGSTGIFLTVESPFLQTKSIWCPQHH